MNIAEALVLSAVEGITEFLPVSSTGHLILASKLMSLEQTEFLKSFTIAIQLGAILAVVLLYYKDIFLNFEVLKRVMAAFIPTAVVGLLLYNVFKQRLLGNELLVVWALLIGGALLILFEVFYREGKESIDDIQKLPYSKCIVIGLCQSVSIIPGVSRAAATIVGGLALGLKRKAIVVFSFLLAIPTMLAATGYDLLRSGSAFSPSDFWLISAGFLGSFVVAYFAVKFLLDYIKSHTFIAFGVYRIIAALAYYIIVIA